MSELLAVPPTRYIKEYLNRCFVDMVCFPAYIQVDRYFADRYTCRLFSVFNANVLDSYIFQIKEREFFLKQENH